jgi:hypothetical protein
MSLPTPPLPPHRPDGSWIENVDGLYAVWNQLIEAMRHTLPDLIARLVYDVVNYRHP